MTRIHGAALIVLAALLVGTPLVAQVGVVVHGRAVDATDRGPVDGVRVLSEDGTIGAVTDSTGAFVIRLDRDMPLRLHVERLGYLPQTYDLPEDAPSRVSVLVLEPAPIEIEGVAVLEESAITSVLESLDRRRNAHSGSVRSFDRQAIEQRVIGGSAYDLVQLGMPQARPCGPFNQDLCRRARGTMGQVLVCIDDWRSIDPVSELQGLPIESVAIAEFYGPTPQIGTFGGPSALSPDAGSALGSGGRAAPNGQVRIYTASWIVGRASRGDRNMWPLDFGC